MTDMKKYWAEGIGTMFLVVFGCGVAVATGCEGNAGIVATSLAFGLVLMAMIYAIGGISGCHINPAVSFAMAMDGRIGWRECGGYILAQTVGATVGAAIIALFFGSFDSLGANAVQAAVADSYGSVTSLFVALAVEILLSCLFVYIVLHVSDHADGKASAAVIIGLTLALVHLLGIRLTGTSVNPARSIGPALLNMIGGRFTPIAQIWIFILGPLCGGGLAAFLYHAAEECDD